MRGAPQPGGACYCGAALSTHPLLTDFATDFLHFVVHFSCSGGVLRRGGISARIWNGLQNNLYYDAENAGDDYA